MTYAMAGRFDTDRPAMVCLTHNNNNRKETIMGFGFAASLAESVGEGDIALRRALEVHFSTNFYPPLDAAYAIVAEAALDAVADLEHHPRFGFVVDDDELDRVIPLPAGLKAMPADRLLRETEAGEVGITVGTALDILRLAPFTFNY